MDRTLTALVLAFTIVVGVLGNSSAQSAAQEATPAAEQPPQEVCQEAEIVGWEDRVAVVPFGESDALVKPLDSTDRVLYLAVWTILPGTCVPYSAEANQKDGGVVLMVQNGTVKFTAEHLSENTAVEVLWSNTDGEGGFLDLDGKETVTLRSGGWVTQNDQVWFTLWVVGNEPAVILKAVWMPEPGGEGCAGRCR